MSFRNRLLPVFVIASVGMLSACAGTPKLSSANGPTAIQFASVDPSQPLPPSGPELHIHGVAYRTFTVH